MGKDAIKWIDPKGTRRTFYRHFFATKYEDYSEEINQKEETNMELVTIEDAKK